MIGGEDGAGEGERGIEWICSGFKMIQTLIAHLVCSIGDKAL